jgi:hypothetical protein
MHLEEAFLPGGGEEPGGKKMKGQKLSKRKGKF